MKKFLYLFAATIFGFLTVYFLGIQIVNVLKYQVYEVTFDFNLLFFDGEGIWFYFLTAINLLFFLEVFYNLYFNKRNKARNKEERRLNRSEKISFSRLSTKHEAKKGLLRIEFNDHLKIGTPRDRIDQSLNPLKVEYNKVIDVLNLPDIRKLNTIKQWEIDGIKTQKRAGIPIMTKKGKVYVDASDTHTLLIGTTGSGKSWTFILILIEIIRMSKESIVVNDPKGELYKFTAHKFIADGYDVKILNFIDPDKSDGWNPLDLAWEEYEKANKIFDEELSKWEFNISIAPEEQLEKLFMNKPKPDYSFAIEMLIDICRILTYDANAKDPYWNDGAASIAIGAGAFMCEEGKKELVNFTSIKNFIELGETKMGDSTLLFEYMKKYRTINHDSYSKLSGFMQTVGTNHSSLKSVFDNKFSILTSNDQIKKMTAISTFDLRDIGKKKTAVFIIVHDEKKTYHPLVTLFVKQMYEQMIKVARDEKDLRLKIPVNIVFDEFGVAPPLKDVDTVLGAARSRAVRLIMAVQDLEQLNKNYGKEIAEVIKGNVMNIAYILSGSPQTQKYISTLAGTKKVWNKEKGAFDERPVVTTDRLSKLNMGEVVFIRQRKNVFISKLKPYNKLRFYTKKVSDEMPIVEKPRVQYFNIVDEYKKKNKQKEDIKNGY